MSAIKISRDEVKKVSILAKLNLSKSEVDRFTPQLIEILNYISQLSQVDTSNVPPISQISDLKNIFRTDNPAPSLSQKSALSQSDSTYKNFFITAAVIDNG